MKTDFIRMPRFAALIQPEWGNSLRTSCLAASLLVAQTLQAQTLGAAAQQVLQDYPSIKAARAGVSAAQAELDRARGGYSPTLSLNASANKIRDSDADQDLMATPMLNWSLPINGRVAAENTRASLALEVAHHKVAVTEQDLALQLSESWLAVVRGHRMLQLAQENVQSHQSLLGDIRRMVEIDAGRALDLTQAQVRLDAASTNLAQRQAELDQAQEKLARFTPAQQAAHFAQYPSLRKAVPTNLAQAQEQLSNPAVAQARAQVAEMQARIDAAKRLHYPTLDVSLGRQHLGAVTGNRLVAQANFSLPLWSGGQTDAGIRSAAAQALAAQDTLAEVDLTVQERLRQAYVELAAAQTRLQLAEQQRASGAKLVQGYREQFKMARRTLLDLLNIQSEYAGYQQAHAQAEHDINAAQFRISAVLGQLAQNFTQP